MTIMKRWMLTAAVLLLAAGCGNGGGEQALGEKEAKPVPAPDPLVGVWLEPIPGQDGWQGWQFEADGTARAVDMFSFEGLRWERFAPDSLRIWSRTARYPEPVAETYGIALTTSDSTRFLRSSVDSAGGGPDAAALPGMPSLRRLVLTAPGGLRRAYAAPTIRNVADGLIGRWTAAGRPLRGHHARGRSRLPGGPGHGRLGGRLHRHRRRRRRQHRPRRHPDHHPARVRRARRARGRHTRRDLRARSGRCGARPERSDRGQARQRSRLVQRGRRPVPRLRAAAGGLHLPARRAGRDRARRPTAWCASSGRARAARARR